MSLQCKCSCGCLVMLQPVDWILCRACSWPNWATEADLATHVAGYDGPRNRAGTNLARYSGTCSLCPAYIAKNLTHIDVDPTDASRWVHAACAHNYRMRGHK